MNPIIDVKKLTKVYNGIAVINEISFSVRQGDLFAFLGTNGAGKSTTINIICTLLAKTSGELKVDGFYPDTNAAEIRSRIGVVFQDNVLDDLLTVEDNLEIRGQLQGISKKNLSTRLWELRESMDLTEIWKRPYGKLSGGQKRKCEIARALTGNPKIIILDEPTTGLDPQTRKNIWQIIRNLQEKQGMTVFLTTHYMEEAAAADCVVILDKGKICAEGTPYFLKNTYGRDLLKLRFEDMEEGCRRLQEIGLRPGRKGDYAVISVNDSHEALKIVSSIGDFLDFELLKGSMDDVFLAVTGKERVWEE